MMISKLVIITLTAILSVSLNVEAGRKRLQQEINIDSFTEADIQKELEFGRNMAAQLLADYQLIADQPLIRYVNLVGNVVLQNASRQEINFYFGVIKSAEINAYATPGGYIFITTAALDEVHSEAELAAILAHEIAHVVERHIVKTLKIKSTDDSATRTFGNLIGGSSSSANALFDQAMGKAFDILFSKGLKVEDEFSADKLGLLLTTLAGYDANSYLNYLKRIQPLLAKKDQQLTKTHPSIPRRIAELKSSFRDEGLLVMGGYQNTKRLEKYKNQE